MPADGTIPYLYFRIPTNFTEDRWAQVVEIKSGDPRVAHHVIARLEDDKRNRMGGITSNKRTIISPPGSARLVKAGASILLQMRYTTMGVATKDRASVGLIVAKERPKIVLGGGNAMNTRFVIPAGADNREARASKTSAKPRNNKPTRLLPKARSCISKNALSATMRRRIAFGRCFSSVAGRRKT